MWYGRLAEADHRPSVAVTDAERGAGAMSDQAVTLELLARLVRGIQEEMREFREQMREFRDQLTVQTAILLRLESAQNSMAEQLRAMASQHQRTDRRLLALDERTRALEEDRR
jgi:hypothetical protein